MKSDSLNIYKVFSGGGDVLYILPHFQREYAWEKDNWNTLLSDILNIYREYDEQTPPEHFMGSLVVINDGTRSGTITAFKLVDGQQRLTTISLVFLALRRRVEAELPALARKIDKMLLNPDEDIEFRYKLTPTSKYGDRVAYQALLKGETPPADIESKIPAAYAFIYDKLETWFDGGQVEAEQLFVVLSNCLQVVFIELEQRDRVFEIFESLNAKARELTQADLVRNYIAMRLPAARQEAAFEEHWEPIENLLQEKRTAGRSNIGELTAFLRHYLAMVSGKLVNEEHVYARFRDRGQQEYSNPADFVHELTRLHQYANYYDRLLRPENEPDVDVRECLERLAVLEASTAAPFLLAAYAARDLGAIDTTTFLEGLRLLENYLVRRFLANEKTNYLNKAFPTVWKEINPDQYLESLGKALANRSLPGDARLRRSALSVQLFENRPQVRAKLVLILETINRRLSRGSGGYTTLDGAATIEHIMPQTLSDTWRTELGENSEEIHEAYLHTLGNLTLVTPGWNSTLSNLPFALKKSQLAQHALRLNNAYFAQHTPRWNENAIKARAEFLLKLVLEIWPVIGDVDDQAPTTTHRPEVLTFLGETHAVASWRDVTEITATKVAEVHDFDDLAGKFTNNFSRTKFQNASRQMPNGWWVYVNLSAEAAKRFCLQLVKAAGINAEEWQVEET